MKLVGEGTVVVAPSDQLPLRCAKTGQPTDHVVVHEVYDSPRWTWALYTFSLWGFVSQLLTSEHHSVQVPMSPAAAHKERVSNRVSGTVLIIALLSLFSPVGPLALPLVLLALVFRWIWGRRTSVHVRARRGEIWLMGLHPEFIEECRSLQLGPAEATG